MIANLSEFMSCARVEKINAEERFNYSVNVDDCGCEMKGNLIVTATSELEALEYAWMHIQSAREETIKRN